MKIRVKVDGYLNSQQVAKILGCSTAYLRQSRARGSLFGAPAPQHITIDRVCFYEEAEIRAIAIARNKHIDRTVKIKSSSDPIPLKPKLPGIGEVVEAQFGNYEIEPWTLFCLRFVGDDFITAETLAGDFNYTFEELNTIGFRFREIRTETKKQQHESLCVAEPQHDIYRMLTEQNPEQEMTATEYAMLIAQAKADIRIDGLSLDTVAKFIVDAGWRPSDYQPEVVKQANAMCSAWVERAEKAISQRKPVTSFDWELQQALIHLQNAISVTDSHRAHLLQAALQITKGVRESD